MVVYYNGSEALVMRKKHESELLKVYFRKGGRNLDDYERKVITDNVIQVDYSEMICDYEVIRAKENEDEEPWCSDCESWHRCECVN